MEIGYDLLGLLGLIAFMAGIVDSIAGGGGLIIVPALLLAGLDPVTALGTNKLQGSFGTFSSTLTYARAGQVDLKKWAPLVVFCGLSSMLGAWLVMRFSTEWLLAIMPLLLLAVAAYFLISPNIRDEGSKNRISIGAFGVSFVPLIGLYDGFFGPGAGSFFMLAIIILLGLAAIPATGLTKYLNFGGNLGALLLFIVSGKVLWLLGLIMGLCNFMGAYLGSKLAMRVGARLIRPLLVFISCAMALRLLMNPANPLRQMIASVFGNGFGL